MVLLCHRVVCGGEGVASRAQGDDGPAQSFTLQVGGPVPGLVSKALSRLFFVLPQSAGGVMQAAAFAHPLKLASGIMRARFSRADGQLWLCGLRGWQCNAAQVGCLQRVRCTGAPVRQPIAFAATAAGVRITFGVPLDAASAADVGNWSAERWAYVWSSGYGSPEVLPNDPAKKGRQPVTVRSVTLSPDRRAATVELVDMKPVPQLQVSCRIAAAGGQPIATTLWATVHALR